MDDYFWYDLGDRAIKTGPDGWEKAENYSVYFRKYGNTASQVNPVISCYILLYPVIDATIHLSNVLDFVNLANDDD